MEFRGVGVMRAVKGEWHRMRAAAFRGVPNPSSLRGNSTGRAAVAFRGVGVMSAVKGELHRTRAAVAFRGVPNLSS